MKITILSLDSVKLYEPNNLESTVMIRIHDPNYEVEDLVYENKLNDVLRLNFFDYTYDQYVDLGLIGSSMRIMGIDDAISIVDFFERNKYSEECIIHCHEGRSRSVAVGIGYCKMVNDIARENELRSDRRYIPNDWVIQLIDKELRRRGHLF